MEIVHWDQRRSRLCQCSRLISMVHGVEHYSLHQSREHWASQTTELQSTTVLSENAVAKSKLIHRRETSLDTREAGEPRVCSMRTSAPPPASVGVPPKFIADVFVIIVLQYRQPSVVPSILRRGNLKPVTSNRRRSAAAAPRERVGGATSKCQYWNSLGGQVGNKCSS